MRWSHLGLLLLAVPLAFCLGFVFVRMRRPFTRRWTLNWARDAHALGLAVRVATSSDWGLPPIELVGSVGGTALSVTGQRLPGDRHVGGGPTFVVAVRFDDRRGGEEAVDGKFSGPGELKALLERVAAGRKE